MSRINDALKRAKDALRDQPVDSPARALRPMEPAPRPETRGLRLILLVVLLVTGLAGTFALLKVARSNSPEQAQAEVADAAPSTPSDSAEESTAVPSVEPALESIAEAVSETPAVPEPMPTLPVSVAETVPVAALPVLPQAPALQAVVYSPKRPWAMIGGKVVFVGDKVGEYRVRSIGRSTVTLVSSGHTNVLSMNPQ